MSEEMYSAHPTMEGTWTVRSHYNGNALMSGVYMGSKAEEKNQIDIVSRKILDKRITDLMDEQINKLNEKPELEELVETLELN